MYNIIKQIFLEEYFNTQISEKSKLKIYFEYLNNIRKFAYKGVPEAQYDLAQHYEDSSFYSAENPYFNNKKRFYWYSKSAKNKYAPAFNNLADLFERGDGCDIDLNKSLNFYKKAMELGDELGEENYKKMMKDMKIGGLYNTNKAPEH